VFINEPESSTARITGMTALRHLIRFQIKLAADALRDLVFSPLSIFVFVVDAVRKPALKDSLYLRLMVWGRRTDAAINLFDQYHDAGHYTVDEAVDELEKRLQARAAAKADAQDASR
jgi:hypothetical protein